TPTPRGCRPRAFPGTPKRREALGEGVGLGERDGRAEGVGEAAKSSGADCATGAVGLVEPTTKWTVNITAVTLAVVHDSQMSRYRRYRGTAP
ncbi:hypothetical protein AB0M96_29480, partial [Streptomyces sp. NPDC051098]